MYPRCRNQGVGPPIEVSGLRPPIPTSFSPFSPGLRVHVEDRKTTQDPVGARPNKSFSPALGDNLNNLLLSRKVSPVGSGPGSRTGTGATTPRYGPFFDASANQFFPHFSSRQDGNSSGRRESPVRTLSPGCGEFDGQDAIHDLCLSGEARDNDPTDHGAPADGQPPLFDFMDPRVSATPPAMNGSLEHPSDHGSLVIVSLLDFLSFLQLDSGCL